LMEELQVYVDSAIEWIWFLGEYRWPTDAFKGPLPPPTDAAWLATRDASKCSGTVPRRPLTFWEIYPNPIAKASERCGYNGWGIADDALERLAPCIPFALLWFFVRFLGKKFFFAWVARAWGIPATAKGRIGKFAYTFWLTAYYVASTVFGFIVIRGEPWFEFPVDPFNSGLYLYAHARHVPTDLMTWYYWYQLGFYIAELVAIFLEPKRKDFMEYVIHHNTTVLLVAGSLVSGQMRVGCMVFFLHDISDIFIGMAKLCHYARKSDFFINTFFGLFVASWIWLRLWCYPWLIYSTLATSQQVQGATVMFWVLSSSLCVLQVLHVVWFYMIIRMIVRLAMGVKGDSRSDSDEEDDSEKKSKAKAKSQKSPSPSKKSPSPPKEIKKGK